MKGVPTRRVAYAAAMLCAVASTTPARAQIGVGTWVKTPGPAQAVEIIMTVEPCCNGGRRLTYRFNATKQPMPTMVVESAFDGKEVPVLVDGKPSGETMAITRVDSHHTSTIVKLNGKPFGVSKATLSADGKTLTVENEYSLSGPDNSAGKQTETWVRK